MHLSVFLYLFGKSVGKSLMIKFSSSWPVSPSRRSSLTLETISPLLLLRPKIYARPSPLLACITKGHLSLLGNERGSSFLPLILSHPVKTGEEGDQGANCASPRLRAEERNFPIPIHPAPIHSIPTLPRRVTKNRKIAVAVFASSSLYLFEFSVTRLTPSYFILEPKAAK